MSQPFTLPGSYKKWTYALLGLGAVAIIYGLISFHPFSHPHGEDTSSTRFWAVMLQNSVFWLLVVNASMFFICATTLAMGGWQVALRRVPEAISSVVPILGVIAFAVLMFLVWGDRHDIYHWVDKEAVKHDKILTGKSRFLKPCFLYYLDKHHYFSMVVLGRKMRAMSLQTDKNGPMDYETGKKWVFKKYSLGFFVYRVFCINSCIYHSLALVNEY
jgi:uncharacterized membrane protein